MGNPARPDSRTKAPRRWARTTMEGSTCRLERHSLGATHWRSLGGCTRALPVLPDLPQAISAMGPLWSDEGSSGGPRPRDLKIRGVLDVEEAFIDGSFAPAKKGVLKSGKQNVAREPKSW